MKNIIVVTKEERKIEYHKVLGFFSYEKLAIENITGNEEGDAIVIDFSSKELAISIANKFRSINKSIPILFITDYNELFATKELSLIEGTGQIRFHTATTDNGDKIVELLNSLIDPDFASEIFKLSVLVPLYNEGERFEHVLNFAEKLNSFLEESYRNSKIYFINDGSVDDTKKLTEELLSKFSEKSSYISDFGFLELKDLSQNTRKAGTYIEGIKNVSGDIIIIVDGDDSFFIEDIAKMVNILRSGYYDVIAATKDLTAENRPFIRRCLSFAKRLLTKPLLPKGIYDSQTGLKGLRGDAARYILPHLNVKRELAIDLEMMYICKKLNFRTLQLPVRCIDRDGSHINIIKDSIKYLKSILVILFDKKNITKDSN
jgi:glycosyltransferase involved in cell wall biosynthesis